jgi:heat shock protein HslJ
MKMNPGNMNRRVDPRVFCQYFRTVLYCIWRVNRPGEYRRGLAVALALTLVGCQIYATPPDKAAMSGEASLAGTQWLLEDLAGRGVVDRLQSTLVFAEAGRVSGRAGCNDFSGPIRWGVDQFTIGPLMVTRKACSPAVSDQETRYLEALAGAQRLRIDGPYLLIDTTVAGKPLTFTRLR